MITDAALGAACPGGDGDCDAGNNEVCSTDGTDVCICNSASSYAAGPVDTATCYLAVNLGAACTAGAHDECKLGDGGTGSICSVTPDCVCDTDNSFVQDGGTCKKDCSNPTASTGYIPQSSPASTVEGATATVSCDTANGYTGTAASITCQASGSWSAYSGCSSASVDLNNACNTDAECQAGNGGANSQCSTNCACSNGYTEDSNTCKRDCGKPTASTGYIPDSSPTSTLESATATVSCDTNNGYTGTAADITCQASSGTWTAYSGCSSGANESRQKYSLVILIGAFVIALM